MQNLLKDIIELQVNGVQGSFLEKGRMGGAGPSDDKAFRLGSFTLMVPTLNRPSGKSKFYIEKKVNQLSLKKDHTDLGNISEVLRPRFYDLTTQDGIPYKKIARLHGSDCLASTVIQQCVRYDNLDTRCKFCGIGLSLKNGNTILKKTPEQLAEVAVAAKRLDNIKHVILTTGTTDANNKGAEYLGKCARAIKNATGLPVNVQFEPPQDKQIFSTLAEMGVDSVGIHIESFDPDVRKSVTPGKASLSEEVYFQAFKDAVSVFGKNQVSTFIILGLGEDEDLTLRCCRKAIEIGVYPFLVPVRPINDTLMEKFKTPKLEYLEKMYLRVGEMLSENGLSSDNSSSGCVKCKACSMLQIVESHKKRSTTNTTDRIENNKTDTPSSKIDSYKEPVLKVAKTMNEINEYFKIRKDVFIEEQGVFSNSDIDEHDKNAIPIIAVFDNKIVGAVRCYPKTSRVWYGGRLSVKKEFRKYKIGMLLVRKAVEIMNNHSTAETFLATIQLQNVRLFQRLGWIRKGKVFVSNGKKHQLMERILKKRDENCTKTF